MDNYKEKFSQIYDQYIEKIYRFVYLKVNSQEIAEDLTSKVFLKGWQAFQTKGLAVDNKEEILNPGAFLYQIARNTVIDHYRDKGRAKIISTDIVPQIVDANIDLEQKAMIGSDFEAVKAAMSNLKQDYQDIIIWHYIDGMQVPEIAEIVGKPQSTVRVMMHRGLKALKKELDKDVKQA